MVPSKLNPAGLGTKNLPQKELFNNKLWFSGSQLLSLPRKCWPDLHVGENFSNYNIDNSSINSVDGESLILTSSCTQSNVNNVNNINLVDRKKLVENKTNFDKNFGVSTVIDIANYIMIYYGLCYDTKLLRCGGRLKNVEIPYESKHPVILPKNNRFTDLIIVFYHCIVQHNGTRDTLNTLCSEYWIPQGRSVNKIIRQCIVCKKHEEKDFIIQNNVPCKKNV